MIIYNYVFTGDQQSVMKWYGTQSVRSKNTCINIVFNDERFYILIIMYSNLFIIILLNNRFTLTVKIICCYLIGVELSLICTCLLCWKYNWKTSWNNTWHNLLYLGNKAYINIVINVHTYKSFAQNSFKCEHTCI